MRLGMLAILAVTLLVVGCGKGPGSDVRGNCTSDFIADYNRVLNATSYMYTTESLERGKSLAEQFKSKYTGTVCTARVRTSSNLSAQESQVNADTEMDRIIQLINAELARRRSQVR